jgi:hypothetical protein
MLISNRIPLPEYASLAYSMVSKHPQNATGHRQVIRTGYTGNVTKSFGSEKHKLRKIVWFMCSVLSDNDLLKPELINAGVCIHFLRLQ